MKKAEANLNSENPVLKTGNGINVDLAKRKYEESTFEKTETEKIKEKLILDEDKDEELFSYRITNLKF